MSELTVGPARAESIDRVLAAYEWLFAPPGSKPPGWDPVRARVRLEATLASSRSTLLVAAGGEELAGFCTAYLDIESVRFGQRCWVEDLAVEPAMRSRGVGAALLAAARRWGAAHGATHLELDSGEARRDAHRFYERERPAWRSRQYSWLLGEEEAG
jgi:GNAT superfamily N-acetyltransferase